MSPFHDRQSLTKDTKGRSRRRTLKELIGVVVYDVYVQDVWLGVGPSDQDLQNIDSMIFLASSVVWQLNVRLD